MSTAPTRRKVKVRCAVCGSRYNVDTSSESSIRRTCPCGGELVPDDGTRSVGAGDIIVLEDSPAPSRPRPAGELAGEVREPAAPAAPPIPETAPEPAAAIDRTAVSLAPDPEPAAPRGGFPWLAVLIGLAAAAAAGWWIWRIVTTA